MNRQSYEQWWQLHLRMAKGEQLSPTEMADYQAGLEILDQEEKGQLQASGLFGLRKLQAQIEELRTIHAQLLAKSAQLDVQIMDLEKTYQALTGYVLTHESS